MLSWMESSTPRSWMRKKWLLHTNIVIAIAKTKTWQQETCSQAWHLKQLDKLMKRKTAQIVEK